MHDTFLVHILHLSNIHVTCDFVSFRIMSSPVMLDLSCISEINSPIFLNLSIAIGFLISSEACFNFEVSFVFTAHVARVFN